MTKPACPPTPPTSQDRDQDPGDPAPPTGTLLPAPDWEELGHRFHDSRVRVGMDQEDVARLAGVARRTVQRLEGGKEPPTGLVSVFAICQAIGIDPAETAIILFPSRALRGRAEERAVVLRNLVADLAHVDPDEAVFFLDLAIHCFSEAFVRAKRQVPPDQPGQPDQAAAPGA